eukprot:1142168-Pelagomonas_calceolata.AAC.3
MASKTLWEKGAEKVVPYTKYKVRHPTCHTAVCLRTQPRLYHVFSVTVLQAHEGSPKTNNAWTHSTQRLRELQLMIRGVGVLAEKYTAKGAGQVSHV